jgi:phosphate-selective porin OprO/OprP
MNIFRGALALLLGLAFLTGCGKPPGDGAGGASASGSAGGGGAEPGTNRINIVDEAQRAAVTYPSVVAQKEQAELIHQLLARIDRLEKKDAEQAAAALAAQQVQKAAYETQVRAHEQRAQQFVQQIGELDGRIASLQAGRVRPEMAPAADAGPTTRELDQKIRIVERNNELAAEAAETRAREQPRLTAGADGFGFASADTKFSIKWRGLMQLDSRVFFDDNKLSEGNDTFVLRRARPIIEGTLFGDFDFQFVPDFGGSQVQIFDAWMNYRYRPELQLKAGKFKGPVGFEQLQSDATLPFNERGLVTGFVPARSVGVQLWGDAFDGIVGYAAGAFNVTGDGRNPGSVDFGDDKEFAGRLSFHPFKKSDRTGLQGLGFGVGGSYSEVNSNVNGLPATTGGVRPGYVTSGQQQFFAYNPVRGTVAADGPQWRVSPHVTYLFGPFGLLGEYGISHQSLVNSFNARKTQLAHTSWQLSAQWILTGEAASFSGIIPNRPFKPGSGGWGAWQLVGRFGQLEIDDDAFPNFSNGATSAQRATAWSVGLNWWLNKNVRVMTSFSHTKFDGGGAFNPLDSSTLTAPATVSAQDENVFFTRLQLAF